MIIEDTVLQLELAQRVSGIELRLGRLDADKVIAEMGAMFPQHSTLDLSETWALYLQLRQFIYDTRLQFYAPRPGGYASEEDYRTCEMTDHALAEFPQASRDSIQHIVKKCVYWMHLR